MYVEKDQVKSISLKKPISMVAQIYNSLSDAIVKGELKPGQPLKEKELQQWFGVSRAPIREAIRLLEADELIVVDAYKKKYVRRITRNYLNDILPLAACLEGFAARLSAAHITDQKIAMLEHLNGQMQHLYDLKDYKGCAEKNFDFHRIFIRSAKNNALKQAAKSVTKKIVWLWITQIYYMQNDLIPLSIKEHKEIIQAFKNGDADNIEYKVREHILNVYGRSSEISAFDENGDLICLAS